VGFLEGIPEPVEVVFLGIGGRAEQEEGVIAGGFSPSR